MIWQDPVDLSYISYEYDHSLLEAEEETQTWKVEQEKNLYGTVGLIGFYSYEDIMT